MSWRVAGLLFVVTSLAADETFPPPAERQAIEARRAGGTIVVDGRLDEADWQTAGAARAFRQIEPKQGEPSTHDTEVRVLFDDEHLYVGAVCHDPAGHGGIRVPDLRRDWDYFANDLLGLVLDPWGDARQAVSFQVNPFGALRDLQVFDDTLADREWDAVWNARTTIDSDRWTVEIAIPWSTLRYPVTSTSWGVNFVRIVRRANELTGWAPWPRAYSPYRMPYAGRLTGIDPPPPSRNVRVHPYSVAKTTSVGGDEDRGVQFGGDLKWAITPSRVLDATVNTDFAQADVDRQVVNLSRFSIFFPEKRQFFLENASLFTIGKSETLQPFFTRRIGLDPSGRPLAIDGGLRYVDRDSRRSLGGLLIRAGDDDSAIARYVHNTGTANRIGAMFVGRSGEGERNGVLAADGFFRLTQNLRLEAMLSASSTSGSGGEGIGSHVELNYRSDRLYFYARNAVVSRDYRAEAGFVPRTDTIITSAGGYPILRPAWKPDWIRSMEPDLFVTVYQRASDRRFEEAFIPVAPLFLSLANGGTARVYVDSEHHRLDEPFSPLPGLTVNAGAYDFLRYGVSFSSDQSRRVRGSVRLEDGAFYAGERRRIETSLTYAPSPRAAFGVSWQQNAIRGLGPQRTAELVAPEIRLALNPRLQLYAFFQRNTASETNSAYVRFAWEYRPLSFVYLVWNDRAATDERGFVPWFPREREVILKVSLMRQM